MSMADNLARIMPTSDNSDLWAIVDEMEERSSRLETFLEVDRKFHKVLASRSDNLLIQQLVAALWEIHTVVYPQLLGLPLVQELDRIVKVHRAIVEACETGDSTKVKATMVEHYTPLREMLGMPPVAD
jgi:DNA-binding FadR family transcriptional regulator